MAASPKPPIKTLRELRLNAGLTQPELAKRASIAQGTLSMIERGRVVATESELQRLSNALGARLESAMQVVEVQP